MLSAILSVRHIIHFNFAHTLPKPINEYMSTINYHLGPDGCLQSDLKPIKPEQQLCAKFLVSKEIETFFRELTDNNWWPQISE